MPSQTPFSLSRSEPMPSQTPLSLSRSEPMPSQTLFCPDQSLCQVKLPFLCPDQSLSQVKLPFLCPDQSLSQVKHPLSLSRSKPKPSQTPLFLLHSSFCLLHLCQKKSLSCFQEIKKKNLLCTASTGDSQSLSVSLSSQTALLCLERPICALPCFPTVPPRFAIEQCKCWPG